MNKADYTTLINTNLPDGTSLPSSQHRATMHTDPNSIIELIYGDGVTDDETSETYTSGTALFDYDVRMYKVGSDITLNGKFTANSGLIAGSSVFEVTDTDFQGIAIARFTATAYEGSNSIPIYFADNHLRIDASVFVNEGFRFTIKYKALN